MSPWSTIEDLKTWRWRVVIYESCHRAVLEGVTCSSSCGRILDASRIIFLWDTGTLEDSPESRIGIVVFTPLV